MIHRRSTIATDGAEHTCHHGVFETMHRNGWARVKSFFQAAAALPAADGEPFLARMTSDPTLPCKVELLLSADKHSVEARRARPLTAVSPGYRLVGLDWRHSR